MEREESEGCSHITSGIRVIRPAEGCADREKDLRGVSLPVSRISSPASALPAMLAWRSSSVREGGQVLSLIAFHLSPLVWVRVSDFAKVFKKK
jgi:hypothetical protein